MLCSVSGQKTGNSTQKQQKVSTLVAKALSERAKQTKNIDVKVKNVAGRCLGERIELSHFSSD
jgi:hypothetical protein